MSNVRLYINNKPVQLISSIVERNGTRAIDTGDFTVTRKTAVTKGDKFQYIQDVINPKHLVGLWNMEKTTRDESGHDIDGDETTAGKHEGSFSKGADGYYYKNNSSSSTRCIKIAHDSHLDLSQQFDLILLSGYIRGVPNNTTGYLLGKGDTTNSIELSVTSGSANDTPVYPKLTVRVGGTTTTITGTTDINYNNVTMGSGNMLHYRWIRIKRDENNLITLMTENTIQGSATISGDLSPLSSSKPLYIAGDKDGSNILDSNKRIAQVRFYSGGYLTDEEWDILRSSRRPTEIMKFGGTVWKIDEKPSYKKCYCKGFADKLHNIEINKDVVNITWTTGDSDIIKNEYFNKKGYEILEDLIKVYNLGIEFAVESTGNINEIYTHYHAKGTLFSNVYLLILNGGSDESFHISPRGTLLMEDDDNDHTKIMFKQGNNVRIHDFGYDDSNVITELTMISGSSDVERELSNTSNDWSSTITTGEGYPQTSNKMHGKPTKIEVIDPNGLTLERLGKSTGLNTWERVTGAAGTNQYKVNYHDKSIYLGNRITTGNYTIKYWYENKYDTNKFYTSRNSTYNTLGAYNKTLNIPQLMGKESMSNLAVRIFNKLGDVERRVTITIPTLVNHIRENYLVKIEDPIHGVGTTGSPLSLSVKSIKFHYPEGKTIINCGEHQFDTYDLDKSFGEAISSAKSVLVYSP